jgi:hypothetical protein
MRQSLYYLEDGLEQGLLLFLCELHFSLIVILLLLPVTSLDDQKLENDLTKNKENLLDMRGQRWILSLEGSRLPLAYERIIFFKKKGGAFSFTAFFFFSLSFDRSCIMGQLVCNTDPGDYNSLENIN